MTTTQRQFASVSLSGIARLARVKRPVVSVWRTRAEGSADPFPSPLTLASDQPRFDVLEVAQWLERTGRGNNPDVVADAAAHARLSEVGPGGEAAFDAVTACIALRAAADRPLAPLTAHELLDLADELDPDDESIYRELERVESDAPLFASFADRFVDANFHPGAAMERAVAERFREGQGGLARNQLAPAARDLVAAVAFEVASAKNADSHGPLAFSDVIGFADDTLIALAQLTDDERELAVNAEADSEGFAEVLRGLRADDRLRRAARRRMRAHGIVVSHSPAACTHLVQLPLDAATTTAALLEVVDEVLLHVRPQERALVVGPAAALVDAQLDARANAARNSALRSGRVRAVVRLPRGLVTASPRQALGLWVVGDSQRTDAAERWLVAADLSQESLDASTRADLVSDIAAIDVDARVRQFRFGSIARLSAVIAGNGSLVAAAARPHASPEAASAGGLAERAAALSARIDELVASLDGAALVSSTVHPHPALPLGSSTIEQLVRERRLRLIAGTRIEAHEVGEGDGFAILGLDELTEREGAHERAGEASIGWGGRLPAPRTVDRLQFVERHPRAPLTEPGDVVFAAAHGRVMAMVDRDGASVVMAPARILRVAPPRPDDRTQLDADVIASALRRSASGEWRGFRVRDVPRDEGEPLREALRRIRLARGEAQARLARINELEQTVLDAVTSGAVTLLEGTP